MKTYNKTYIIIAILSVVVLLLWISTEDKSIKISTETDSIDFHSSSFFEEENLFDEILNSGKKQELDGSVFGGVIPHHLLASDIITQFFSNVSNTQPVERIILIGPNHYERGNAIFTTSKYGWETSVGKVIPDIDLVDELVVKNASLEVNEEVIKQEHSIGGIVPFVAHYFPNARVVPIIISRQANLSDLENLANLLRDIDNERTIFIASVDFSHYLSLSEAEEKDQETLEILRRGDLGELLSLDEANADSPESLALLLLLTSQQGIASFDVLDHKNSADYTKETEVETTSYYSIVFTK